MKLAWTVAMLAWCVGELVVVYEALAIIRWPSPCPPERRRRLVVAAWSMAVLGVALSAARRWFE